MSLEKSYQIETIAPFRFKIEYAECFGALDPALSMRCLKNDWAFYVIKEANTPILIDNTVFLLKEGDTLMVPPFRIIRPIERNKPLRFYRILIPKEFLERFYPLLIARASARRNRLETEIFKNEVFRLSEDLLTNKGMPLFNLFSLLEQFSKTDASYTEDDERLEAYMISLPLLLKKTMLYMKNHFKAHLTLEILSKENGLSASLISHLFKEHLHLSPKEYLTYIRMQAASELFFCARSIEETAALLSYRDASRFSSDFKRFFGVTPSKFVKNGGHATNMFLSER